MRCEIDIKKFAYASAEGGGRPLRPSLDPPLTVKLLYETIYKCGAVFLS